MNAFLRGIGYMFGPIGFRRRRRRTVEEALAEAIEKIAEASTGKITSTTSKERRNGR